MTTLREAAQQALEALVLMRGKYEEYACAACDSADSAITVLRAALAEPTSCAYPNCLGGTVGTFCHDACIKKDGHARTTD